MEINTGCLVIREKRPDLGLQYRCYAVGDFEMNSVDIQYGIARRQLIRAMRSHLGRIAYGKVQADLKRWIIDSDWKERTQNLFLILRDRTIKARLPFIIKPLGHGFLAQSPPLPGFHLILNRLDDLEDEACRLLPRWIEKQPKWKERDWSYLLFPRDMWWETFKIDFDPVRPMGIKRFFACMARNRKQSGLRHLQAIGTCLDEEVQDQSEVLGRSSEIDQLYQLLLAQKRNSIALVGEPGVGKSSIIHEVVRRRVSTLGTGKKSQNVWQINSQRIVTGMMYIGQWQERWLGILREIYRRDHVLAIEDPIGLLTAGQTSSSNLTAAEILTAFAAVHPIRLLTELTPQALGILRIRKRELADLFLPIHIDPIDDEQTVDMMISRMGELEVSQQRFFHPASIPLLVAGADRYRRSLVFPGKVTQLMEEICRQRNDAIAGYEVTKGLERRTGLRLSIRKQKSKELEEQLKSKVIGQDEAIDRILPYLARVNAGVTPNDRPAGVFLCLGPTGVGKTETAKAIAQVMFEGDHHLLRFDMNEINTPLAAEQLIGTFDQPDGKLTGAVRRQPFSILLFDEIEKAHPDVFDYLLQVLGEGRLTDAIGRTIDFRDAIIFMTSNLGAREAERAVGFESNESVAREHYLKTAASFFRPEFINRIDDIILFRRLARQDIEKIARIQVGKLVRREGIRRRSITMQLSQDAMDWLIDRGYDPQLGARVLKREIERLISQPIADILAEKLDNEYTLVPVDRVGNRLETRTISLPQKRKRKYEAPEFDVTLKESQLQIDSLLETCEELRDSIDFSNKRSRDAIHYYGLKEQVDHCRELRKQLFQAHRLDSNNLEIGFRIPAANSDNWRNRQERENLKAKSDLRDYRTEDATESWLGPVELQWYLLCELEYARLMVEEFGQNDDVVIYFRLLAGEINTGNYRNKIEELFAETIPEELNKGFGFSCESPKPKEPAKQQKKPGPMVSGTHGTVYYLIIGGIGAKRIAQAIEGLYAASSSQFLFRVGFFCPCDSSTKDASAEYGETEPSAEDKHRWTIERLQEICASPDPVFDENAESTNPHRHLRGVFDDHAQGRDYFVNSDGLSSDPYHSPKGGLIAELSSRTRRALLDWLLIDRRGEEVSS